MKIQQAYHARVRQRKIQSIYHELRSVVITFRSIYNITGFDRKALNKKDRHNSFENPLVYSRQLYCYILRNKTALPIAVIGHWIDKDHATVIHSTKVFARQIEGVGPTGEYLRMMLEMFYEDSGMEPIKADLPPNIIKFREGDE